MNLVGCIYLFRITPITPTLGPQKTSPVNNQRVGGIHRALSFTAELAICRNDTLLSLVVYLLLIPPDS